MGEKVGCCKDQIQENCCQRKVYEDILEDIFYSNQELDGEVSYLKDDLVPIYVTYFECAK